MLKLVLNPTYLRFNNPFEMISQNAFVNKFIRIVSPLQSPFTNDQFLKLQNGIKRNPEQVVTEENQTRLFNQGICI